jgi:hypothetical protein
MSKPFPDRGKSADHLLEIEPTLRQQWPNATPKELRRKVKANVHSAIVGLSKKNNVFMPGKFGQKYRIKASGV